jgi:hypothetical protein
MATAVVVLAPVTHAQSVAPVIVQPAGAQPRLEVMRVPLEAAPVKGAPYSAEIVTESVQTLADGNRIINRTTGRVYRDSEGRTRREEDRSSGLPPTISISDPESGVSYSLDTENHIAWKTPSRTALKIVEQAKLAEDVNRAAGKIEETVRARSEDIAKVEAELQAAGAGARGGGGRGGAVGAGGGGGVGGARGGGGRGGRAGFTEQRVEEKLPPKQIEGVRAEGIRRTATIPAGAIGNVLPIKIVSEEWTSPDLNVLVLTQHNDPRVGETSYRLQNIIRGEPNAAFFQVPPDYTVRETGIRRMR